MLHDIRWTAQKIHKYLQVLDPLVYRTKADLPPFRFFNVDDSRIQPHQLDDFEEEEGQIIPPYANWGVADTNFVLKTTFRLSADWQQAALFLPIGSAGDFSHPEAFVYIDSDPYAAVDRHHQEVILPDTLSREVEHSLSLYGWTGNFSDYGWTGSNSDGYVPSLEMGKCSVVEINQPTRDFVALVRVGLGIADQLESHNPIKASLLTALNDAVKKLDTREPLGDEFYESILRAHEFLRENIKLSGGSLPVKITAAGHAHIDIAWLWTISQSRRKAGKTFYNALRLMEQFPEFRFSQSQAQLYDFVRQDYPELFNHIEEMIKKGQWEPLGGMWVEADCNITGGESLVRQLILGRKFFREHFGDSESRVLWLPDVFGFPWSLPQLVRDAGLDSFFTIKVGWSQYNRMPYDSFWWQGLDGTRILTHFSTTKGSQDSFVSTYNSKATPDEVITSWKNFQQKDLGLPGNPLPLLMVYGYGDGGGGPTREMVENLREMKTFPGSPQVQMGKVRDFFKELRAASQQLPTWNDELYLEYHRGTYTTQARNKRANRKSEVLLHNAEFATSIASLLEPGFRYPKDELNEIWKLLCLNQFHDILPGSSIGEVYEESLRQYDQIKNHGEKLFNQSLKSIAKYYSGDFLVMNPTSFFRNDPVFIELEIPENSSIECSEGSKVNIQKVKDGTLLDVGQMPPYSIDSLMINGSVASDKNSIGESEKLRVGDYSLENSHVKVTFNERGDITSLYYKDLKQEIILEGRLANQFQAFEDRPITPDAWEIDISYDDKMWLAEPAETIEIIEDGPLRAGIEIKRKVLTSELNQRIYLYHNSPRIIFDTEIDWQDKFVLLKVAFPVQVLSPFATYEIQWGEIQRPTHRNTSWDWAKFEVPGQKWVDLSEGGYGVSLMNDCKYGFDIHENVIRMTLLRSPSYPDPKADVGHHQMTYSLLPHGREWRSETIPAAYALNFPQITFSSNSIVGERTTSRISRDSFFQIDQPNVIIETIKRAEDGNGLIIRVFENQRRRCECKLTTGFELSSVQRVNIIEEELDEISTEQDGFRFQIEPFQILSFRLIPGG